VDAAPALPVLMAAYVLTCFGYLFGSMIVVLDLQVRLVAYSALALVFNVVLNLVLIPPFGFLAAAWVTLATQVLVFAVAGTIVLRRTRIRLTGRRVLGAVAAAGVMAAAVEAVDVVGAPFSALVAVAAVTYVVALVGLRVVDRDELRVLVRRAAPA
jgi:O-antigen/teichoic acid export membrane protein